MDSKKCEFRQQWILQLCRITADLFSPSPTRGILKWFFQVEHGLQVEQVVGFVDSFAVCGDVIILAVFGCMWLSY